MHGMWYWFGVCKTLKFHEKLHSQSFKAMNPLHAQSKIHVKSTTVVMEQVSIHLCSQIESLRTRVLDKEGKFALVPISQQKQQSLRCS